MLDILVLLSDDRSIVGRFKFEAVPRAGEEITIPWVADDSGVRIFDVDEVKHRSEGIEFGDDFPPGYTVLHVTEIT